MFHKSVEKKIKTLLIQCWILKVFYTLHTHAHYIWFRSDYLRKVLFSWQLKEIVLVNRHLEHFLINTVYTWGRLLIDKMPTSYIHMVVYLSHHLFSPLITNHLIWDKWNIYGQEHKCVTECELFDQIFISNIRDPRRPKTSNWYIGMCPDWSHAVSKKISRF